MPGLQDATGLNGLQCVTNGFVSLMIPHFTAKVAEVAENAEVFERIAWSVQNSTNYPLDS